MRRIILLCLLAFGWAGLAEADTPARNAALVIANGSYAIAGALTNPANDGALVAGALRKAGFAVVVANDLSRAGFERALRDFHDKASGAHVAMVYYAGHGIEDSGKNWLLPVDAVLASSNDLPYEAIDLDRVMDSLNGAQVRMVVLDACRNSPFARSWRQGSRSLSRGLARIEADDYLVIYAAAPGQTASDGIGGNSPFARSLAARIEQPGLAIQMLGGLVRDDVMAATNNEQRPFVSSSITGTPVYLSNLAAATAAKDVPMMEALAWQGALNANTRAAYEDYQQQFPKGRFAKLAKQNIKRVDDEARHGTTAATPKAPVQYASLMAPGHADLLYAGSAPSPTVTQPTGDTGAVAALNMNIQAHNDAVSRQNKVARDAYASEVASVDERTRRDQEAYARKVADFQAEQEQWQQRVRACETKKVAVCARTAAGGKGPKADPDEVLTWHEGLILCKPAADGGEQTSLCEGPLWSGPILLGSTGGDQLLVKACGTAKSGRDLGVSGGMRVFGCGFGTHPEDPRGTRKGNLDTAAKFGLASVPGRADYHCPRHTSAFCRSI